MYKANKKNGFTTTFEIQMRNFCSAAEMMFTEQKNTSNDFPSTSSQLQKTNTYMAIKKNVFNTTLEIKIKDFRTATEMVSTEQENIYKDYRFLVSASVFPNGSDKDSEGWLVILPNAKFLLEFLIGGDTCLFPDNCFLTGTVSIIDIQGNSRLPRYFEKIPTKVPSIGTKYLKKASILNKADEFLNDGVLTLHCDIEFSWDGIKVSSANIANDGMKQQSWDHYFSTIPQAVCRKNDNDKEDHIDAFTVYDLTSQIFTSTMSHDSKIYFDSSAVEMLLNSVNQSKKENSDVWIIDTYPDKFCLFLDEHQENVGARLMKSSPVIRLCVNNPMKEQHEKRIDFLHVDSQTFKLVLYYLENKSLPDFSVKFPFKEILNIYIFSHMYLMEQFQKKCADSMVKWLDYSKNSMRLFSHMYSKLKNIADTFSDEYLLSSILEYENPALVSQQLNIEDKIDSFMAGMAWR